MWSVVRPYRRSGDFVGPSPTGACSDTLTGVDEIDVSSSSGDWLTLPDVAERLGVRVTDVRRMLDDRQLVAVRRGERDVLAVPAAFVGDHGPLSALPGTFTVLSDSGFGDEEIVEWMFAHDDTLPGGSAIGAIRNGAKKEVRRRAMEQAL